MSFYATGQSHNVHHPTDPGIFYSQAPQQRTHQTFISLQLLPKAPTANIADFHSMNMTPMPFILRLLK